MAKIPYILPDSSQAKDVGYRLVRRQCMDDGLLRKDVKVLYGVIQDDTRHSDSSQGIGHVNACVGE